MFGDGAGGRRPWSVSFSRVLIIINLISFVQAM